jgi:hypothetical protein
MVLDVLVTGNRPKPRAVGFRVPVNGGVPSQSGERLVRYAFFPDGLGQQIDLELIYHDEYVLQARVYQEGNLFRNDGEE